MVKDKPQQPSSVWYRLWLYGQQLRADNCLEVAPAQRLWFIPTLTMLVVPYKSTEPRLLRLPRKGYIRSQTVLKDSAYYLYLHKLSICLFNMSNLHSMLFIYPT